MINTEETDFKWGGKREGAGRNKTTKTQVKDFIKEYPQAVEALMTMLYERGIKGDVEAAKYVIDRIKGKPTAILGVARVDSELVNIESVLEFRKQIDEQKLLGEGRDAVQRQGDTEESGSGSSQEA